MSERVFFACSRMHIGGEREAPYQRARGLAFLSRDTVKNGKRPQTHLFWGRELQLGVLLCGGGGRPVTEKLRNDSWQPYSVPKESAGSRRRVYF
jgi:hypothetical protein